MSLKIDLTIVILNFNTEELLKQCLASLDKADKSNYKFETIVIDNASTDGSVKMVEKEFPLVKIIKNSRNLGFSAGNNIALKKAKSRYLLLLNPDTEVEKETLVVMLDYLDHNSNVGIATCRVELTNGNLDDASHRGFPTPWNALCHFSGLGNALPRSNLFNGYHLGYQNLDKPHEIDACTGAFMLVRSEVGEKLNWLDEDYFWYGEDLDFCYRAKQAGWKVMFVPQTKILHWKGASSGMKKASQNVSTANLEIKRQSALASTMAMRVFYNKHYQEKYPKFLTGMIFLGVNLIEKNRLRKI